LLSYELTIGGGATTVSAVAILYYGSDSSSAKSSVSENGLSLIYDAWSLPYPTH
jgi:hypothetical protein